MGILDILFGGNSSSNNEKNFSHGETVMVKYNGKVGVIIAKDGDYYTVKLKDENENEYCQSFYGNELDKY